MPFSKTVESRDEAYWTQHYDNFLKPLIQEGQKLQARRSEPIRQDLLRQIIADLVTAPIVVADLTDRNANVYWELGVRQGFKHGTITIIDHRSDMSFDLSTKGTLKYYPDNHLKNEGFRKSFKEALADCLDNPSKTDSIVLESVSGRGSLFEFFNRDEALRRIHALTDEIEHDRSVLRSILTQAESNQKKPQTRSFTTELMRTSAIDLLNTHRYLDEPDSFYRTLSDYLDDMIVLNEQLNLWETSPDLTEKWIIETYKSVKRFDQLEKAVTEKISATREKILKSL